MFDFFHNQGREPIKRIAQQMQEAAEKQAFEKAAKLKEDWLFLTRFANQNQRISQANQRDWQLMWLPCQKKNQILFNLPRLGGSNTCCN